MIKMKILSSKLNHFQRRRYIDVLPCVENKNIATEFVKYLPKDIGIQLEKHVVLVVQFFIVCCVLSMFLFF